MRILLVKPPSDSYFVFLPIGLGYIAAYLNDKAKDVEIKILNCILEKYNHNDFAEYVKEFKPDLVGITAFTVEIKSALKCCQIVKTIDNRTTTVIGGPHTSNMPEQVLSDENVDFIFRNEAEIGFFEFVNELMNNNNFKNVTNLGYKADGEIKLNPVKVIDNLDDIPFPDYELMGFERYPKTYKMKYYPSASIITSRGCPFPCTFCSAGKVSGKKYRSRSPANIIKEINLLKQKNKIKEFLIWDDNFSLNKSRVHEFCDLLIKEEINLPWWCSNGLRTETLDEELIIKMRNSGLYAIILGIETGTDKIQKDMKKNLDFNEIRRVIEIGYKHGIRMEGFFIIGYPTETREDILETIKLSLELPLRKASFFLFQPLVGSEIYEDLEKEGRLKDIDVGNAEWSRPSVLPIGFESERELKQLQRKAILSFYLRPRVFFPFIIENLSVDQLKELGSMVNRYILFKN
ncbi:MAG: Radical SAM domain protein [Candidatus Scalindua rubra]|uniref:Radical SAM domain protein n=1 Tax=Candidatus Scalindua rubra TaxID=1872076 RepID=A0A1E3X3U6_9BACT|nr:MAG: Radical SAM domain protein [Candidatus Scalindua rubra]